MVSPIKKISKNKSGSLLHIKVMSSPRSLGMAWKKNSRLCSCADSAFTGLRVKLARDVQVSWRGEKTMYKASIVQFDFVSISLAHP